MGPARMEHDPKTSVLNGYNQVHAAKNVFITDGACMTSSAYQNPYIKYMALTARACDYSVKELKKENIQLILFVNARFTILGGKEFFLYNHWNMVLRCYLPLAYIAIILLHKFVNRSLYNYESIFTRYIHNMLQ